MNNKIVILGCPRSGTSLVANLVRSAGYDADYNGTKTLMKPNQKFNPDGYFERIDIVKLNDKLIKEYNEEYSFLNPPKIEEMIKKNSSNNEDLKTIKKELQSYSNWFIKDSRLCFTLHLYNIPDISIIKVKRNPKEVKKSMINHYGDLFSLDVIHGPHKVKKINFEEFYENINKCIDWQKRHKHSIEIEYDDLYKGNLQNLEDFLGHEVNSDLVKKGYRNYEM